VLDTGKGTGAVTRVLVDTTDGEVVWTTIGVSENIIEASWQALYDSVIFGSSTPTDGAQSAGRRAVASSRMTQPTFVPISEADQVRPAPICMSPEPGPPAARPNCGRHGVARAQRGTPGPDAASPPAGHRFAHDLILTEGRPSTMCCGCALIAARRAALFGRGPSIYDVQLASPCGLPG